MTTPNTKRATPRLKSLLLTTAAAGVLALPAYADQATSALTGQQLAQTETETEAAPDDAEGGSGTGTGGDEVGAQDEAGSGDGMDEAEAEDGGDPAGETTQEAETEDPAGETTQEAETTEGEAGEQETGDSMAEGEAAGGEGGFLAGAAGTMIQAENLIGASVAGGDGESVGTVRDLLLDAEGNLQGVVISSGGFLGIGEKRVGVSWDPGTMRLEGDSLQTALTQEEIKNAPEFGAAEAETGAEEPAGEDTGAGEN